MTGKGKGKAYFLNKPKFNKRTSDNNIENSDCKWEDLPTPPQESLPNLDIEGIRNPPSRDPYLPPPDCENLYFYGNPYYPSTY
jgi:hypothetical protein